MRLGGHLGRVVILRKPEAIIVSCFNRVDALLVRVLLLCILGSGAVPCRPMGRNPFQRQRTLVPPPPHRPPPARVVALPRLGSSDPDQDVPLKRHRYPSFTPIVSFYCSERYDTRRVLI